MTEVVSQSGPIAIRCTYTNLVPLSELSAKRDPKNRNQHPKEQIDELVEQFKWQGVRHPIIISKRTGLFAAGDGRFQAAEKLGMESYPVDYQDFESEAQEYSFRIADNSIQSWSELDLSGIQSDLPELEPFEIERLAIQDFRFEPNPNENDPDDVPEVPKVAKTKRGELWLLGDHRLLIDDCTVKENVERLMGGEKADMVFTDPPYGIGLDYESHDDSEEKWFCLMDKVIPLARLMAPFVLMPACRIKALPWWYSKHTPDWIMCWYKGSPGHCSHVGFNDWEPHLVWGKPKNQMHDYWQTECGFDVDGHPCPKPVAYCQWVLERAVNNNDRVLDLFLGSGSTLIACEKTGRKCYGCEIEPLYCDVIIERFMKFSGKMAVREDGTPYSAL